MVELKSHFVVTENILHPETRKILVEVGTVVNRRLITRLAKYGVDNVPCVLFINK